MAHPRTVYGIDGIAFLVPAQHPATVGSQVPRCFGHVKKKTATRYSLTSTVSIQKLNFEAESRNHGIHVSNLQICQRIEQALAGSLTRPIWNCLAIAKNATQRPTSRLWQRARAMEHATALKFDVSKRKHKTSTVTKNVQPERRGYRVTHDVPGN